MPNRLKLLAPPPRSAEVKCPSCGHSIDHHNSLPYGECGSKSPNLDGSLRPCLCKWLPNDIATYHLVGDLSRMGAVQ